MALKLDKLTQRIADQSKIDRALLIKNDRIGRNARPRVNVVKKNLTGVDEELLKEYQQIKPQQYEYIDEFGETKYRKYSLPQAIPELEPVEPDISERELNAILGRIEDEKMKHLALLERAQENLKKNREYQQRLIDGINEGNIKVKGTRERMLEQAKDAEHKLNQYIGRLHDAIYQEDARKKAVNDDFFQINSELQKARKSNLDRVNMYRDELNFLNKGAFSTEKADNESEMEYLERLQRNAEIQSPEDELTDAKSLTITKFREKMRELIKDPVLIEQVINTLDNNSDETVDDKANLLKNWSLLKTKFISTYGVNNKRLGVDDIISFFNFFLQTGESGLSKAVEGTINLKNEPQQQVNTLANVEIQTLPSEDMLLIIVHSAGGDKTIFIRSVNDGSNNHLLYSFTGEVGSFREFFDKGIPSNRKGHGASKSSSQIEEYSSLTPKQFNAIFDIATKEVNPSIIAKKLFTKYGIRSVSEAEGHQVYKYRYSTTKGQRANNIEYGMGVQPENIPQYVSFGNVNLLLQKLYYHNQLSVKNKQMKSVAGFRTTKVSEQFVKLIMNMLKGLQPSHSDITSLSSSERQLYDRLVQVANLNKSVAHNGDKTIAELKQRLKMIEAEISIGNNSPLLKKELYAVLHSLKNFKVITQSQINSYLKQFS